MSAQGLPQSLAFIMTDIAEPLHHQNCNERIAEKINMTDFR